MKARHRTCDELGLCQARPGCGCSRPAPIARPQPGARHPFAPGAIEGHRRPAKLPLFDVPTAIACSASGGAGWAVATFIMDLLT